jgi:hypothetical protein
VDDLAVLLGHENTDASTAPGPVVSYPFDESGGVTAYDATSNGRNATLTGSTFSPGQQGNALTLSATNQSARAVSVNVPSAGGSFTVAFWIKINSVGATEYPKPVNNAGWQAKGWHITSTPGMGIAMYIWTKNNSLVTDSPATGMSCWLSQPLAAATWTHVAYTFDRTNGVLRGFRNGVSDSSATIPAGFGDISILTGLHLGAGFSDGQMDDFRLWDTVLTAAEVASILSPDPTLALRLKFDESAGAANAWDSSIHRRSGVLTNMDVATAWQSGRIDGALAFDGINDHVSVPAFNIPEAVTVACWAKSATPEWNSSGCLVSQFQGFTLSPEQGGKNMRFAVHDGSTAVISTPVWVPPVGFDITSWHHYAGVFNPATDRLELYVDGYLVSFLPTTASMNVGPAAVTIGRKDAATNSFNGLVDDVRIHSRALDWWEMLEMSRQIDIGPYAATETMHLATDVDGDGLATEWELAQGFDPMVANNPFDDSGDHDGLGLLLEYALNQSPISDSSAALPSLSTVTDPGDGETYLTIQHLRRINAPQLLYTVQTSDELFTWNSGAGHTTEISATPTGDGVTELVTTRVLPAIGGSNTRRLARLRVAIP